MRACGAEKGLERTIWGMLLDNLHNADNPRNFAVGVVEESQVALFHIPEMSSCYSS